MTQHTPRRAYGGSEKIKDTKLQLLRHRHAMDEMRQHNPATCLITSCIGAYNHGWMAEELGVDNSVVFMAERIYESMPEATSADTGLQMMEAIPAGADTTLVAHQLVQWLLLSHGHGLIYQTDCGSPAYKAVTDIGKMVRGQLAGQPVSENERVRLYNQTPSLVDDIRIGAIVEVTSHIAEQQQSHYTGYRKALGIAVKKGLVDATALADAFISILKNAPTNNLRASTPSKATATRQLEDA